MPRKRTVDPRIEERASPERAGPFSLARAPVSVATRVSAAAVDFIVLAVIGFGLTTLIGVPTLASSLVVVLVMLVVTAIYLIGSWTGSRASTPGMRLFGLALHDAVAGAPIARAAAVRRWLVLGAPFALGFFYGWGVGLWLSAVLAGYYGYLLFTLARSVDGRGLHDEISESVVISTRAS
jgi:uncharacterized RDD family membrane protein YckC